MTVTIDKKKLYKAIEGSNGIISHVAKQVGHNWVTVNKAIQKDPKAVELLEQETEKVIDLAETKLHKQIEESESWAIKWYLATKGKKRGYTEKSEIDLNTKGLEEYQDLIKRHREK